MVRKQVFFFLLITIFISKDCERSLNLASIVFHVSTEKRLSPLKILGFKNSLKFLIVSDSFSLFRVHFLSYLQSPLSLKDSPEILLLLRFNGINSYRLEWSWIDSQNLCLHNPQNGVKRDKLLSRWGRNHLPRSHHGCRFPTLRKQHRIGPWGHTVLWSGHHSAKSWKQCSWYLRTVWALNFIGNKRPHETFRLVSVPRHPDSPCAVQP